MFFLLVSFETFGFWTVRKRCAKLSFVMIQHSKFGVFVKGKPKTSDSYSKLEVIMILTINYCS